MWDLQWAYGMKNNFVRFFEQQSGAMVQEWT